MKIPKFVRWIGACALALVFCGGCTQSPPVRTGATGAPGYEYRVALSPDMRRADVLVCFGGAPPARLVPSVGAAGAFLLGAERRRVDMAVTGLPARDGVVELVGVGPDDCVSYAVDLGKANGAPRPTAIIVDGGALLSTSLLFWGPPQPDAAQVVRVSFAVPEGWYVAAPFEQAGDHYVTGPQLFRYIGQLAVVRHQPTVQHLGDVDLTVVREPGKLAVSDDELQTWLASAVSAVRGATGTFPVTRLQAIVVPVPVAKDPVVFGSVVRGGGYSVVLFVSETATLPRLLGDWVAVHELSHLLLPFVPQPWFGEGMATYYQEVLRARAGTATELEAWRAMDRGFSRGRDDGTGKTLAEESGGMMKDHAFRRVYWSGAALALTMDVMLRRAGGRIGSLDALLAEFRKAQDTTRTWDALELLAQWDHLVGNDAFVRLCQEALGSSAFVDLTDVYKFLGITRDRLGEVTLDDTAPGAAVRRAIMGKAEPPRWK